MTGPSSTCIFCQIATSSTSTQLLHTDEKVVAFQDINPSAFRQYLVIPVKHIATARDLQKTPEDYSLVRHLLKVGQMLLQRDAPQCLQYRQYIDICIFVEALKLLINCRKENPWCIVSLALIAFTWFGFHQPPLNSVHHLHLHCLALPFIPRWKHVKYILWVLRVGSLKQKSCW